MKVRDLIQLIEVLPPDKDIYIENNKDVYEGIAIEAIIDYENYPEIIGYLLVDAPLQKDPKQLELPFERKND